MLGQRGGYRVLGAWGQLAWGQPWVKPGVSRDKYQVLSSRLPRPRPLPPHNAYSRRAPTCTDLPCTQLTCARWFTPAQRLKTRRAGRRKTGRCPLPHAPYPPRYRATWLSTLLPSSSHASGTQPHVSGHAYRGTVHSMHDRPYRGNNPSISPAVPGQSPDVHRVHVVW